MHTSAKFSLSVLNDYSLDTTDILAHFLYPTIFTTVAGFTLALVMIVVRLVAAVVCLNLFSINLLKFNSFFIY